MKFRNGSWDGFIHALRESDDLSVIDCSSVTFAEPTVIAAVAALAQTARTMHKRVQFIKPESADAALYMSRMHLNQILDDLGVWHDFVVGNEHDQTGRLVELHKFKSEGEGEALAGMICDRMRDAGGVSPVVLEELNSAIAEIATNTAIHADTPHGYAVAQTYPRLKKVSFTIADAGIGLYASLSKNDALKPDDDAHALSLATVRQMSGTGEQYRGYGLPNVVESVRALGGTTRIASGLAASTFSSGTEDGQVSDVTSALRLGKAYTGVIVDVVLPWEPGR